MATGSACTQQVRLRPHRHARSARQENSRIYFRTSLRRKLDTADFFQIHFFFPCSFDICVGVSLPYSKLDADIERLFGPTVIRRRILSAGSQALAPVCAHACELCIQSMCLRVHSCL